MYQVIDGKTKKIMGNYKTLRSASRAVDRLDNKYGGYRYYYKNLAWEESANTCGICNGQGCMKCEGEI